MLPNKPTKNAFQKVNIFLDAKIPPVAKIASLGITIITAYNTILINIPM